MDGLIIINHLPLDDGNYDFMDTYDFITFERKQTWKETFAEIEEVRRAVVEDVADELIYYIQKQMYETSLEATEQWFLYETSCLLGESKLAFMSYVDKYLEFIYVEDVKQW